MFEELETHILDIFNNLNITKDVFILRPEGRKGIQIIFKHVNVRCSIRIYPTTSEHLFLYINGHHQQHLSGDKVVENFREDFLTALSNYHNQRYTAPLEGLIEWQQTTRLHKNNYLNIEGNYIPKNLALNDNIREEQLFELPTRSFADELRTIANMTLKEKKNSKRKKSFKNPVN